MPKRLPKRGDCSGKSERSWAQLDLRNLVVGTNLSFCLANNFFPTSWKERMKPCLQISLQMPESTWNFDTPSTELTSRLSHPEGLFFLSSSSFHFFPPNSLPPQLGRLLIAKVAGVFSFLSPAIFPVLSSSSSKKLQKSTAEKVVWF